MAADTTTLPPRPLYCCGPPPAPAPAAARAAARQQRHPAAGPARCGVCDVRGVPRPRSLVTSKGGRLAGGGAGREPCAGWSGFPPAPPRVGRAGGAEGGGTGGRWRREQRPWGVGGTAARGEQRGTRSLTGENGIIP